MLRVGLTGGLGAGKSTVAAMLAARGARVISADELGRELMRPGTAVYDGIVRVFGDGVVLESGELDRRELARLAFAEGRIAELNAMVHPATIARQQEMMEQIAAEDPRSIVVVESALIFEAEVVGWRERFDVLVLVAAAEEIKVARFVERSGGADRTELAAEARRRLSRIIADDEKGPKCDFVVRNEGSREDLEAAVGRLWRDLLQVERLNPLESGH